MLDIFFTVDVEVWCDGWDDLDAKFPDSFRRYVYGDTPLGQYGLPLQLRLLEDHGLKGVFFVEPLFATRFGVAPLEEIVGLLRGAEQEVQLHLHTEWVDEAKVPLIDRSQEKRQFIRNFSLSEQQALIAAGSDLLKRAGSGPVNAFRAGNFGMDAATLKAVRANGLKFDSSYNASVLKNYFEVIPGAVVCEPMRHQGVYEYPLTVYRDGSRSLRHTQLGACSYLELEGLLWKALEAERKAFVMLSHNFELLNRRKDRPDDIVVGRMRKLCRLFDHNRDCFRLCVFRELQPAVVDRQPKPMSSPIWKTGLRMAEQIYRPRYG